MQHGGWSAIGEGGAVAGVEVAFGRQAFGQDHVVHGGAVGAGEFEVEVGDGGDVLLDDGRAVDQVADGDQHAVGQHGVVGAEAQVAVRLAGGEGVGVDAHRLDIPGAGVAREGDGAMADPAQPAGAAARGERDQVAGDEVFDGYFAAGGQDAGAAGEAGGVVVGDGADRRGGLVDHAFRRVGQGDGEAFVGFRRGVGDDVDDDGLAGLAGGEGDGPGGEGVGDEVGRVGVAIAGDAAGGDAPVDAGFAAGIAQAFDGEGVAGAVDVGAFEPDGVGGGDGEGGGRGGNGAVVELQRIDIGQGVGAAGAGDDEGDAIRGHRAGGDDVLGVEPGQDDGVGAAAAVDGVVAQAGGDGVVAGAAVDQVGQGAAADLVVAGQQQGHDIAGAWAAPGVVEIDRADREPAEGGHLGAEIRGLQHHAVDGAGGGDAAAVEHEAGAGDGDDGVVGVAGEDEGGGALQRGAAGAGLEELRRAQVGWRGIVDRQDGRDRFPVRAWFGGGILACGMRSGKEAT